MNTSQTHGSEKPVYMQMIFPMVPGPSSDDAKFQLLCECDHYAFLLIFIKNSCILFSFRRQSR